MRLSRSSQMVGSVGSRQVTSSPNTKTIKSEKRQTIARPLGTFGLISLDSTSAVLPYIIIETWKNNLNNITIHVVIWCQLNGLWRP